MAEQNGCGGLARRFGGRDRVPVQSAALQMEEGVTPVEKTTLDFQENRAVKTQHSGPCILLREIHE